MAKRFDELRERLLRAGVAPRHVRRYVKELSEHLADLKAEEERAGRSPADAEAAGLARLGSAEELAKAMIGTRQFQSWSVRAPWAAFALVPLGGLAIAWIAALSILASGWLMFKPQAVTPFIPVYGFAVIYFGIGRMLYFGAPTLIGWAMGVMAARQRSNAIWLMAGLVMIAWCGGTAQVYANRTVTASGLGPIHVGIYPGRLISGMSGDLLHAAAILAATVLPYLVWRVQRTLTHAA